MHHVIYSPHIVPCMAPVASGVKIAKLNRTCVAQMDLSHAVTNLSCNKIQSWICKNLSQLVVKVDLAEHKMPAS